MAALAGVSAAAPPEAASADDVRELREMLERINEDNADLRRSIDGLRAREDADWLTEARAADIRAMVTDVVNDADQRSSLQSSGFLAGWDGAFFLQDPDGNFRLQFDGHAQVRFIFNHIQEERLDSVRSGFEVTRTKFTLSGHVLGPDLEYLLRTDATRNEPGLVTGLFYLRDYWFRYRLDNEWSVRAGQFKLPFNREEMVSSQYQLAIERSLVNESLNIGRSQGIELAWNGPNDRWSLAISDGSADEIGGTSPLGIVNSNPRVNTAALQAGVEWAVASRWERLLAGEWNQFRDFTSPPGEQFAMLFGVGGHAMQTETNGAPSAGRNEQSWAGLTADLSVEWGGANMFGSFIWQYVDNGGFGQINIIGGVIQGGFYVAPRHELFARWEYGQFKIDGSGFPDIHVLTTGWNWYIDGHDAKFTLDLGIAADEVNQIWDSDIAGYRTDQPGDEYQFVFRSQFQLLF
ncbi:MAG: porin [Phycisphaerales bacterium]